MAHRSQRRLTAAALTLAVLSLPALAQQGGAAREMTPEEKAMMAAWEKAVTPGPQHAQLAASAGTWDVASTWWTQPGAPPEQTTGTAERSMILGGRVLVEKFKGSMMGQPFEGMGTTGYDNVSRKWWGTWMDTMGTGMMTTAGTCEGARCEFVGTFNDPMTGGPQTMRIVAEHGAERETTVLYGHGPDGKEAKLGELVYTRRK